MNFLAPAPYAAFETLNGNFAADAIGLIYNVTEGPQISDLIESGCIPVPTFGSGGASMLAEGNIFRFVSGGQNPGVINGDNVLATFTLPANTFDGISNRGVALQAWGNFANNTNSKEVKLWINCTAAVVGSTVSGGTKIADTGAYTTTGACGWNVGAQVFKYGAPNSNTQYAQETNVIINATHSGLGVAQALTMTENAPIIIAVTGDAVTALTDISLWAFEINAVN